MITLKTGPWTFKDYPPSHGKTVFSCFHCGGGSTMGYKLAGFNVLGGVEIDPEMMKVYRANHHPKHSYLMGVQEFKNRTDLPPELFNLDILDGSPPCSSFSMAGSREKAWGEKKKFREGQAEQVLDDLFFDFIDIAKKLSPKIVVAENVKGLIQGNARGYVKQIFAAFRSSGYSCQLFLLNSSRMGVPQARERTFFVARRNDLPIENLKLAFNEPVISVEKAWQGLTRTVPKPLTDFTLALWKQAKPGENMAKYNNGNGFNNIKFPWKTPAPTVAASGGNYHPLEARHINDNEYFRLQTFPDDFKAARVGGRYVCGMSVPPFMMQRVAHQVHQQLLTQCDGMR